MDLQHLPLGPALVYFRVPVLQVTHVPGVHPIRLIEPGCGPTSLGFTSCGFGKPVGRSDGGASVMQGDAGDAGTERTTSTPVA